MTLGSQVQKYRKGAGLSFPQLTELSGVETGTINALEKRNSKRSEHGPALAKALGLTLEELLDLETDYTERVKTHLKAKPEPVSNGPLLASDKIAAPWSHGPWPFRVSRADIAEHLTPDDLAQVDAYIQAIVDTRQRERLKNCG